MNFAGRHPNQSRIRRREEGRQAEEADSLSAVAHTSDEPARRLLSGGRQLKPSAGFDRVQPPAEQMRKRPRRSPRLNSPLDLLAVVELQLVMQFLDTKSRLKMARCSRRLLHAASHAFSWKGAKPFVVEARTPADVGRIAPSLLRFAPIHLRCIRMVSLECVAAVPQLYGLQLHQIPNAAASSLVQQLQHPCRAQLLRLRLDEPSSRALLSMDTMALIRLPQLRALGLWLPHEEAAGAALLQPLQGAPALTDLSLSRQDVATADMALLEPITRIGGLRRLSLGGLAYWRNDTFRSFFCSPNMRRLQHLELDGFFVTSLSGSLVPSAGDYESAFSSMQQLQSLALDDIFCINLLLPHLRFAPALCLLSIRCQPDHHANNFGFTTLPIRSALAELLAAASQLEVRLLLPPSLDRWLTQDAYASAHVSIRTKFEEQWHRLQRMAAKLDRVAIIHEESL